MAGCPIVDQGLREPSHVHASLCSKLVLECKAVTLRRRPYLPASCGWSLMLSDSPVRVREEGTPERRFFSQTSSGKFSFSNILCLVVELRVSDVTSLQCSKRSTLKGYSSSFHNLIESDMFNKNVLPSTPNRRSVFQNFKFAPISTIVCYPVECFMSYQLDPLKADNLLQTGGSRLSNRERNTLIATSLAYHGQGE